MSGARAPSLPVFDCEVTEAGLQARAQRFGGDISKLEPPDNELRVGDRYSNVASGCTVGDRIVSIQERTVEEDVLDLVIPGIGAAVLVVLVAALALVLWRRRVKARVQPRG